MRKYQVTGHCERSFPLGNFIDPKRYGLPKKIRTAEVGHDSALCISSVTGSAPNFGFSQAKGDIPDPEAPDERQSDCPLGHEGEMRQRFFHFRAHKRDFISSPCSSGIRRLISPISISRISLLSFIQVFDNHVVKYLRYYILFVSNNNISEKNTTVRSLRINETPPFNQNTTY